MKDEEGRATGEGLPVDRIALLALDVDGVLTDGSITIDDRGVETKSFSVRDGHALKLWQRAGHGVAIITGRESQVVEHRARELGIETVRQGAKVKLPVLEEICHEAGSGLDAVCYVGDDLPDLPVVRAVGFGVAVADAVPELKAEADYITRCGGGRGAAREVIELILKAQGRWADIVARYY